MLRLKKSQSGFTIPELVVVLLVIAIMSATMFTFAMTSFRRYLALQQEGTLFGELATQSQRVASVLRGLTDITEATSDDITIYAYFYPTDTYVSLVHYYKNAANTVLYADVTPMTANPPIGTPITAQKKTYTIISNLYPSANVHTFGYLDSLSNPLTVPITDLHTIKGIVINLAIPESSPSSSGNDALSLQVSLRNRKSNL